MKTSIHHLVALLLPCLLILGCPGVDKAISEKDTGQRADSIAQKIMQATNYDTWQETAIVGWTFAGKNKHIWDRQRKF